MKPSTESAPVKRGDYRRKSTLRFPSREEIHRVGVEYARRGWIGSDSERYDNRDAWENATLGYDGVFHL